MNFESDESRYTSILKQFNRKGDGKITEDGI